MQKKTWPVILSAVIAAKAVFLTALCVLSCQRRPLYVELSANPEVLITPDWGKVDEIPEGIESFIYDEDGRLVRRILSSDISSISYELPDGLYTVVVISDSESEYRSLSFHNIDSYRDLVITSRESGTGKSTTLQTCKAEWLSTGVSGPFEINIDSEKDTYILYRNWHSGEYTPIKSSLSEVPCMMRDATVHFRLKAWVDDAKTVTDMKLYIQGVSIGWNVSKASALSKTGTLEVQDWRRTQHGESVDSFESEAVSFGFPGATPATAFISILFDRSDGSTYSITEMTVPVRVNEGDIELVIASPDTPILLPPVTAGSDEISTSK